jgi:peptide deformylase
MKDEKVIVDDQVTTETTPPTPVPTLPPTTPPLIITHFDLRFPVLEQKSLPCDIPLASEDLSIVERMKEELVKLGDDAVGLAGVQIGIARSLFIMKRSDGTVIECINPSIVSASRELTRKAEGCLSLPNMVAMISRPKTIVLSYFDAFGTPFTTEFRGLEAKIVAHEMDHLKGRMINYHMELQMEKNERVLDERRESILKAKKLRKKMAKIHKRLNRRK